MSTISETDIDQLAASQLSAIKPTKNRRQLIEILLETLKPITISQILDSNLSLYSQVCIEISLFLNKLG